MEGKGRDQPRFFSSIFLSFLDTIHCSTETVLYCTVQYSIYNTLHHCTVLYSTLQYIQYIAALYCTVQYCLYNT